MAISYEQVASAAESIKAEGGKPTLAAIHARLGSGSMSTITKFMQRWKGEQPQQQTTEVALPEQMKVAIIQEMERYASQRVAVVRDELDEATQAIESLTAESETLEDAALHAEAEASKWRGLADDRKELAQRQEAEIQRLKGERSEFKAAFESLTLDLATSRASIDALKRERDEAINRAQSELTNARQEVAQAQEKVMSLSSSEARLNAQNEAMNALILELKESLKVAQERSKAADILEAKLTQRNESISELKAANDKLQSALNEKTSIAASLDGRCSILSDEVSALKNQITKQSKAD